MKELPEASIRDAQIAGFRQEILLAGIVVAGLAFLISGLIGLLVVPVLLWPLRGPEPYAKIGRLLSRKRYGPGIG